MFYKVVGMLDFLNKLYTEALEKKMKIDSKRCTVQMKLEENKRYIEKLLQEDESGVDLFSPRKQNKKLQKTIVSLEEDQKKLQVKLEELNLQLSESEFRLSEFEQAIQEAKEKETHIDQIQNQYESSNVLDQIEDVAYLERIIHKLELCKKIIDVDTNRCKLELDTLTKVIRDQADRGKNGCD